jgi:hypothetical protein
MIKIVIAPWIPLSVLMPLFLTVSGCVAVARNYLPQRTEISEPPLHAVSTAHVGDNMLRQGQFTQHDAIFLHADVAVGLLSPYTLKRGYYLKQGEDQDSEFYQPSRYEGAGAIVKAALADPPKAVQAHKAEPKLCVVTVFNVSTCTNQAEFERTKQPVATADSFQQTLIYSGRIGSKIKIGYREFSNNLARPAFNNDVEYDLGESPVIGYKGARIEVLEATNEYIKYKVLRNFNPATY